LIRDYKKWLNVLKLKNDFEFNSSEQRKILFEESNFDTLIEPDIKGRIIHKLLQKNIRKDELEQGVNELLQAEEQIESKTKNSDNQLKENIIRVMNKFILSAEYEYINSFKDFKNEFEAYYKLSDFYLFGIIDKTIFTKNKIIVVDFKTDNIGESDIPERVKKYVPQLHFYSFILKRMYNNIREIEMRIDFTNYPEKPFIKNFTKNDEIETENKLEKMITAIRNNNYSVNLEHCSECVFALKNNRCVLNGENNFIDSNVKT
jgi:hypothetical protein